MTKINRSFINKIKNPVSLFLIILVIISQFSFPQMTYAATNVITAISDTMTRQKVGVESNHSIRFTVSQAVKTNGDTIVITFPNDFNFNSKTIAGVSLYHGPASPSTPEALAASADGTNWGAAFSGTQQRVLTLTVPTDGTGALAVEANDKMLISYGSGNALNGSTNTTYIVSIATTGSNPSVAGSAVFAITLLTEDTVSVSATVNPTLTWAISGVEISDSILSAAQHNGVAATTFSVGTNGPGGYVVSYYGTTPTNGTRSMTVDATGNTTATVGTELFGINLIDNSDPNIGANPSGSAGTTNINYDNLNKFAFAPGSASASGQTTLVSAAAPIATGNYTVSYLMNISLLTPPGTYRGTMTYICTGRF